MARISTSMVVALLLTTHIAFGQTNIDQMEYFLDTDPGVGHGTPVSISAGATVNTSFTVPTTNLGLGFHRLFVRTRFANGQWGHMEERSFYLFQSPPASAPDITAMEYFVDSDPGVGHGTPITITAGASVSTSFTLPTTSLGLGFHRLYVRARFAGGRWGQMEERSFYIYQIPAGSAPNITAMEYFIDTDPGAGHGTSVPITAGTTVSTAFTVPTNSLSLGIHRLYLRSRFADGRWGQMEERSFYLFQPPAASAPNITAMEYFIDTDPGVGHGTSVPITAGTTVNTVFTVPTTSLSLGVHRLYLRSRFSDGRWGQMEERSFYLFQSSSYGLPKNITAAEIFFDTDPGVGHGTPVPVGTPGQSINQTFSVTVPNLSLGAHYVYTRVKFSDGRWGLADRAPIQVFTGVTCYADTDGDGYGNPSSSQIFATSCGAGYVSSNTDCNDASASIHPGATEVCNGIDEDCDNQIDEGVQNTYYADNDGDGYGGQTTVLACTLPANASSNNLDCNDADAAVNPTTLWYLDADNDNYYTGSGVAQCSSPGAGYRRTGLTAGNDCDDSNAAINPATVWYLDADNDNYYTGSGVTQCASPGAGYRYNGLSGGGDCDDTNASINPGVAELCNGLDDNCNGQTDEGATCDDGDPCTSDQCIAGQCVHTPVVTASISGNPLLCAGETSALTATGGSSLIWSTGESTASITVNTGGTYHVTVTENGCSATNEVNITVNPVLSVTGTHTNPVCSGSSNGSISATASGGVAPYQYAICAGTNCSNFGSNQSSGEFQNLPEGDFTIRTTDANGCTAVSSAVNLVATNVLNVTIAATDASCAQANNGTISASVAGGSGNYTYAWTGPNSFASNNQSPASLFSGMYQLTVTDNGYAGCSGTLSEIIGLTHNLSASITQTQPYCNAVYNGALSAELSGCSNCTYDYTWITNNVLVGTTTSLSNLSVGTYTFKATAIIDGFTCFTEAMSILNAQYNLSLAANVTQHVGCDAAPTGAVTLSVSPANHLNPPFTFDIGNGNNSVDASTAAQAFPGIGAGNYANAGVVDANGCPATTTFYIAGPSQPLALSYTTSLICDNTPGTLDLNPTGGAGNFVYNWSNGATTQDLTGVLPGNYIVTVSYAYAAGTGSYSCSETMNAGISGSGAEPEILYSYGTQVDPHLVDPTTGTPYTPFHYEFTYRDADNDAPLGGFPKLYLDADNNGSFERVIAMIADDNNAFSTGRKYFAEPVGLLASTDYRSKIVVKDVQGCPSTTPQLDEPDIMYLADVSIFANDITFLFPPGESHPEPNDPITVMATVQNESDFPVTNIVVRLESEYISGDGNYNAQFPADQMLSIPAHSTAMVSWQMTTPPEVSFVPMRVRLDATELIAEPNELDNNAVRPFLNGDYLTPVNIVMNASAKKVRVDDYDNCWYYHYYLITGHAEYAGLPPGVPTIIQGATVGYYSNGQNTIHTDDKGNFTAYIGICPDLPLGTNDVTGLYVTDNTLSSNPVLVSFDVLPDDCGVLNCDDGGGPVNGPNLVAEIIGTPGCVVQGSTVQNTLKISNVGNQEAAASAARIAFAGLIAPSLPDYAVSALAAGSNQSIPVSITYNTPGTYRLNGIADVNEQVLETAEGDNVSDNYFQCVIPLLPDLVPGSGSPVAFVPQTCQPTALQFKVNNVGFNASGSFNLHLEVLKNNVLEASYDQAVGNLDGYFTAQNQITKIFNHQFAQTGEYKLRLTADDGNMVNEYLETNNSYVYTVFVDQCGGDLIVSSTCSDFYVTPNSPAFPGNVTVHTRIQNTGPRPVTAPFDVTFKVNGTLAGSYHLVYSKASPLGIGQEVLIDKTLVRPDPSQVNSLDISVDGNNNLPEPDENNNTYTAELSGDLVLDLECNYDHNPISNVPPYAGRFWDAPVQINTPVVLWVRFTDVGDIRYANTKVRYEWFDPSVNNWVSFGDGVTPLAVKSCGFCFDDSTIPQNTNYLPDAVEFIYPGDYQVRMTIDPDDEFSEPNENNNVLIVTIHVVNVPDLRTLSQYINPSLLNPEPGAPVDISVSFDNIGQTNLQDEFNLSLFMDNDLIGTLRSNGLVQGDHKTLLMPTWTATGVGGHLMHFVVDSDDEVPEGNEDNNEATRIILVGQYPNLRFQTFAVDNPSPGLGELVTFNTVIENQGDIACTAVLKLFYKNETGLDVEFFNESITVGPNATMTVSPALTWSVLHTTTLITARIQEASPEEYYLGDNEATLNLNGLTYDFASTPMTCLENGSASVSNVAGGSGNYTVLWFADNQIIGSGVSVNKLVPGSYTLHIQDNNNALQRVVKSFEISLYKAPPMAVCQDITVELNASGIGIAEASGVNNGSIADCGIQSLTLDRSSFTCADIGINPATLTIRDLNGIESTCSTQVSVLDNLPPTLHCEPITLALDANGTATLAPEDIFDAELSMDNCSLDFSSFMLNMTSFGCNEVGVHTVVLNGADVNGNTASCSAEVTVVDNTPPAMLCQDATVNLDENGIGIISTATVDAGSTDACGILSSVLDQTQFNCADLGVRTVILTITDMHGNVGTCSVTVTIQDLLPPVTNALPVINGACSVSLTPPVAQDNCTGAVTATTTDPLSYMDQGSFSVTWTYTDGSGNVSTQAQQVVVDDNVPPAISCPGNQTLFLDLACAAALPDYTDLAVATDNCSIALLQSPASGLQFSEPGNRTVSLNATDPGGNTTICTFYVAVMDVLAPSIICGAAVSFETDPGACQATAVVPAPSATDNCSAVLIINDFNNTANASGIYSEGITQVNWTATDAAGNTTSCQQTVTVTDHEAPVLTCPGAQTVILDANCAADLPDFTDLLIANDNCTATSGLSLTQLPVAHTTLTGYGTLSVQLTATDARGNEQQCQFTVHKDDHLAPTITCPANQVLLLDGSCSVALPNYSSDAIVFNNCAPPEVTQMPVPGTTLNGIGATTLTLTATDIAGNTAACVFTVTRADVTVPDLLCPSNQMITLNDQCEADLPDYRNLTSVADNCSTTLLQIPVPASTLNGTGTQTITMTVTDLAGNSASCAFTLTRADETLPVITHCPADRNVSLNALCQLTVPDLVGEVIATDNCVAGNNLSISQGMEAGSVLSLGHGQTIEVVINVTDLSNNTAACMVTLTAQDQQAPSLTCPPNQTLLLDNQCEAIMPGFFELSLFEDNCTSTEFIQLSQTPLSETTLSGTGSLSVSITATDLAGNASSCSFNITKTDQNAPDVLCQNYTVQLDANGSATVTETDLDAGSSDACGPVELSILSGQTNYSCEDAGQQFVLVLQATDPSGNMATCSSTVAVADDLHPCCAAPTAICQNSTIYLDNNGQVSLSPTQVNNGSTYDCGLNQMLLDISSFDCTNLGVQTVTLTVTDQEGSSAQCTALVSIADNSAPVPVQSNLPMVQAECSVTVAAPTAQDNCAGMITGSTTDPVTYSTQGTFTIHWTFTDGHGNTSNQTQEVVLDDNIPLSLLCPGTQIMVLNSNCEAALADFHEMTTITDNCGNNSKVQTPAPGTIFVGAQTVALSVTATDAGGNQASCMFNVVLEDQTAPTSACKDITVQLDAAGTASINAISVDNGSTDACGIQSRSVSPNTFTCSEVGTNVVLLTVTDVNGNTDACSAVVTVQDHVAPIAQCQAITVLLDDSGNGSSIAADIDNGSSDACGIQSLGLNLTAFTCADLGPNTATLTVTDMNGNTAVCTTIITVEDNVAPQANCKNVVVALNNSGLANINATSVNNGSTDACGIQSLSVVPATFSCADLGQNTVFLTVTDQHGNAATCSSVVSVEDDLGPTVICPQGLQTLALGPDCDVAVPDYSNAMVTLNDNCTVIFDQNPDAGTLLGESGYSFVNITVSDPSGHTAVCDILLNVVDNTLPVARCRNITAALNLDGQATITAAMVNDGSSDACGISVLTLSPASFDCSQVGENTVTLTVKDMNNNVASCQATVTVQDVTVPSAQCRNILVSLNAAGQASVSAADINNNSTDACGIASLTIDQTSFTCAQVGPNAVALAVTDNHGNISTCTAVVSIADQTVPVAVCMDATVSLDASGAASLDVSHVGFNVSDACGIAAVNISPNSFTCAGIGANLVTLTASDQNGNTSTCTAIVTVQDNTTPVARCHDAALALDVDGNAIATAVIVDDGSSDACGIQSLNISPAMFHCNNVGSNTVVLTVTDINGNTASCQANVVITDITKPSALCHNVTLSLDASGNGTLLAASIDAGTTDACGIASLNLSQTAFNCAQIGSNVVNLTATDVNGNTGTCSASITVADITAPIAKCRNITVNLSATGNAGITAMGVDNGSSDACSMVTLSVSPGNFSCTSLGANPVVLTATDSHGNSSSCTAIVTVQDNIAPQALCKNVTVQLDAGGIGILQPGDVNNGSSDVCGIATQSLNQNTFGCIDVGVHTVTLTVTDWGGNSQTCTAQITVAGSSLPVPTAELTYVFPDENEDCDKGSFKVNVGASNICGDPPSYFAVIRIPSMNNPVLIFKIKNKKKLQFKVGQNKIQVEAPNPQAWWAQILEDGGVRVLDGQFIQFEKKENSGTLNYDFNNSGALEFVQNSEMVLVCKVFGASGYTAKALDWAEIPCELCDNDDLNSDDDNQDNDCDGIVDECDQCWKGNDSVDNNNDGLPDCAYPPGYHHIITAWKCGPDKVLICHKLSSGASVTQCINYTDLAMHQTHGDFLGPCNNSDCLTDNHGQNKESDPFAETPLDMLLFPNPTYEELYIELMGIVHQQVNLEMFGPLGNLVWHDEIPDALNDVISVPVKKSGLQAGVYTVVLRVENKTISKRFVIAQ